MSGSSGGGLTVDQIQALIPQPADSSPPPVAVSGAVGTAVPYARSDHTHTTSVQRARMPVGTNGLIVWVFATPYDSGTVPVVTGLVEAPAAATQEYALQVQGPPTNTSVTLKAFAPPAATVSLLGVAASVSWPVAPAGTYIHVQAAKPTQ